MSDFEIITEIEVRRLKDGGLNIYIKGLLHLHLALTVVTVQSWLWPDKGEYWIEYTMKNEIRTPTMYANRKLWETILKELDRTYLPK